MTGYVGEPGRSRADREEQYLFVNGRATSAPLIYYAMREAYRTRLPKDRHPCVFLFITVDPGQVDVNVHPTKTEVRFRRPGAVRDGLIEAIRETLGTGGDNLLAEDVPGQWAPADPPGGGVQMTIENLPQTRTFHYPRSPRPLADEAGMPFAKPGHPKTAHSPEARAAAGDDAPTGGPRQSPWSWCRVIGQIGGRYVVLETEDGVVMMDPRAAHERVLYERFLNEVISDGVRSQNILIPETVAMTPKDAARVRKYLDLLKKMGFGISEFGGETFVVDAMPAYVSDAGAASLLPEIAMVLETGGTRGGGDRWREEAIARTACRAAVRARAKLKLEELEQLVVDLSQTEMPYTCPQGRPTLIFTSYNELNRKFGRD